ncbi:hypothetical protein CRYUN_Cryun02cG0206100 [Craigia yunnanensis]
MVILVFRLLCVSYWTEPALVFTLYYHLDLPRINGHSGRQDCREDAIDYIPRVRAVEPRVMMPYRQQTDITSVCHQIIFNAFEDAKNADFVLCNTVQELELVTISALHAKVPFYAIGPIFPSGFTKSIVATSLWSESDCTQWLDKKPHGSVFSDDADPLPIGFNEEVGDRSMIIPWCCQNAVLAHLAIGGFLTHYGWNSILESTWCKVPFLCYPLLTDQFTNRKLVVDDWIWKTGINLSNKMPIRKEVSDIINRLMNGKSGDQYGTRSRSEGNIREGFDTQRIIRENMDKFIKELKAKIQPNPSPNSPLTIIGF